MCAVSVCLRKMSSTSSIRFEMQMDFRNVVEKRNNNKNEQNENKNKLSEMRRSPLI